jgi:hypothetical protein
MLRNILMCENKFSLVNKKEREIKHCMPYQCILINRFYLNEKIFDERYPFNRYMAAD